METSRLRLESASVKIGARNPNEAILLLSLHELGHVLGVGHVSCCQRDLMNPYPVTNSAATLPTSLDLYAVHILASDGPVSNYALLSNKMPYQTMPDAELTLPELPNPLLALVCVAGLALMRRRQLTK